MAGNRVQGTAARIMLRALSLARCRRDARLFSSQRAHRKKLMPAGFAAQRRQPQYPSKQRRPARHVLAGDALQFVIAANPAMRIQKAAKRHGARPKSYPATLAAPWQVAHESK